MCAGCEGPAHGQESAYCPTRNDEYERWCPGCLEDQRELDWERERAKLAEEAAEQQGCACQGGDCKC
jgi:hypothetical protein